MQQQNKPLKKIKEKSRNYSILSLISQLAIPTLTFLVGYQTGSTPTITPKQEEVKTTSSTAANIIGEKKQIESTTDNFETNSWTIPQDLLRARAAECIGRKTSLTGGFCLDNGAGGRNIGGNEIKDEPLGNFFATRVFSGQSVIDLGAGLGHYGKMFQDSTVSYYEGYDGGINVFNVTNGFIKFMDLTQPDAVDQRACPVFDWVISLEVAEHIPPEKTDAYMRNIRCRARKGAVISWGQPRQTGGLGHVNLKTEEQAIAAVERWGFKVDWDLTKEARNAAVVEHFKRTVIIYRL